MQKVAALIILSESNLAEDPIVVEPFLAKQNGEVTGRMSLFSGSGSILIKTTLVKPLQRVIVYPDCSYQNKYEQ